MNPPSSAPSKRALFGGIAVLAIALFGLFLWWHGRMRVGPEEVTAFLDRTEAGGRVRFSDARIEVLKREGTQLRLGVSAVARAVEPLYSRIDTADYLRRTFGLDSEATAETRRILAGGNPAQNPEFAGSGPFPADPYGAVVLRRDSTAGADFVFRGVVDARREGDVWALSLASGGFEGSGPQGELRSAFGGSSFISGDAGDDTRLRALADDLRAFGARLAEARRRFESGRASARDERRKAFLAVVAPGRIFRGLAMQAGEEEGTPLYLEITGVSPANEVTALLRGDGGWRNARSFQGSWTAGDDFQNPTLNLNSLREQAVRNAGPVLENTQTWTFALRFDSAGGLSEQDRFFRYRFEPLSSGQGSALKARLSAEFDDAVAATKPGTLYQGAASSRASDASEPILLRIVSRSEDGSSIEARLESTTRSWKRTLRGAIIANARRSGGEPIRLRTGMADAVEDAPPKSMLGDPEDLDLRLGVEGGTLIGSDEKFTYRFAAADLGRIDAGRAARAARFLSALRDGIVYDGVLRDDQGFGTPARLEIGHIDRETGAISGRMQSLLILDVYQEFAGTCDPASESMALGATGRGSFDSIDHYGFPFLMAPGSMTLRLALVGNSITGRIEGDPHWTMDFPVAAFLSAPTESPDPGAPPAGGSVFPAFPKEGGAYLLSHGEWVSLPRNQGHVVVEKVHTGGGQAMPNGIFDIVTSGVGALAKVKGKVAYLEFPGKEARPESSGTSIVLLFIGRAPSNTPVLELAGTRTVKDGKRRVQLLGGSGSKIKFGEQRIAAYVRQVAPDIFLLTTTAPLPSGPYALNADTGYELIQR